MASFFKLYDNEDDEGSCCPQLGFQTRVIGFCVCTAMGYFLQAMAFGSFLSMLSGHPEKFSLIFTLGNIISLAATGFLVGFKKQISNMADQDRRYTSIVFVSAMIGTLISSQFFHSGLLVLVFLIVQTGAYVWYVASYIPYGRTCLKDTFTRCCKR